MGILTRRMQKPLIVETGPASECWGRGRGMEMSIILSAVAARVLGALIEKEITTPEYYPLSLNALVNASNQKNNREPVMSLDEETVRAGLHELEDHGLAGPARSADGRVAKYEHWTQEVYNFTRGEVALFCALLLRGPQTPGELRGRTERMYRFEELSDVLTALQRLMQRDPSLVTVLQKQAGAKEVRYMHLLCGEPSFSASEVAIVEGSAPDAGRERLVQLEEQVQFLQSEVEELKRKVERLMEVLQ